MRYAMERKMAQTKQKFEIYIEKMKGLSPLAKLNKGFSYVANAKGDVVKSIETVKKGDMLSIYVTDGVLNACVEDTSKEEYYGR